MLELKAEPEMRTTDLLAAPPAVDRIESTLQLVGELLDVERCFAYRGHYHFPLGAGWSIAITPDSAGRFRVARCSWSRPVVRYWTHARDEDRLEELVRALAGGVRQGV
jgi:hypothetical protein